MAASSAPPACEPTLAAVAPGPARGARQQGMPGLGRRRLHGGGAPRRAPSCCRSTASTRPPSRRSPAPSPASIERIVLTASGGPFRTWSLEQLRARDAEQALRHPNWSMGAKITIDSATLMNKGLELIEAYHLFPVDGRAARASSSTRSRSCTASSAIADGSVLAQLASPDMRTPIALALSWPQRMAAPTKRLDLVELGSLSFERPTRRAFRRLAWRARRMQQRRHGAGRPQRGQRGRRRGLPGAAASASSISPATSPRRWRRPTDGA